MSQPELESLLTESALNATNLFRESLLEQNSSKDIE